MYSSFMHACRLTRATYLERQDRKKTTGGWVTTIKPFCINYIMHAYTEVMVHGEGKEYTM